MSCGHRDHGDDSIVFRSALRTRRRGDRDASVSLFFCEPLSRGSRVFVDTRGGLRQAWPYAAVALHYLDGFGERFGRAAQAADNLFGALREHGRCEILRSAAATNVSRLHVRGSGAADLPERLLEDGIAVRPALHASAEGAEFELFTNETILRRPTEETIEAFVKALGSR